jgi:uncharacterized protein (DUF1697 family)
MYSDGMASFVALLRAINVGGTGILRMSDLRDLCDREGFRQVRTYIQSGNIVFTSSLGESKVKSKLERALAAKLGKPVGVQLRSGAELAAILCDNPFAGVAPNRVLILFFDEAPPRTALVGLNIPGREEVILRGREVFVHYPDGQGRSKLKLPFAKDGTGRNLNTIAKLAAMVRELE